MYFKWYVVFKFIKKLGKVDVEKKTCERWQGTVDQYPSEPVFVPSPQATKEDDGK